MLLFLFMVAIGSSHSVCSGVAWDLAAVRHPVSKPWANRYDAIRVGLTRDGSIYFRNEKITVQDLPGRIREQVKSGAEHRVYLQIDGRAKYGDVKVVLDRVRDAGIEKVTLLVEKQRE